MSETVNFSLTVSSVIDNLDDFGLTGGDPEINRLTTDGELTVKCGFMKLTFSETSESGEIISTMFIKDSEVRLYKRGAIDVDMRFSLGECEKTIYRIGPYAFDMEIKTKSIKQNLDQYGGELTLVYAMNIGGQDKNVRMTITAKRK